MLGMTESLKVKHRGGFSLLDMKHFVETRGYEGAGYRNLTFEQLLTYRSPIVPVLQYGNPHFIVVRGLTSGGRVNIADPGFGNRAMSVAIARLARWIYNLVSQATGLGITANIIDCYAAIIRLSMFARPANLQGMRSNMCISSPPRRSRVSSRNFCLGVLNCVLPTG
jgi:Peptidase C39 family